MTVSLLKIKKTTKETAENLQRATITKIKVVCYPVTFEVLLFLYKSS